MGGAGRVCLFYQKVPSRTSLAVMLIVCVRLLSARTPLLQHCWTRSSPPALDTFLLEGLWAPACKSSSARATLGSASLKLSYPPLCSLFVSLPCCFRGISCVLPIRLISIVNNRCGAPGNPPPLLVDCKGFWLFLMRSNPYPPQGAESLCQRPGVILFCSVF